MHDFKPGDRVRIINQSHLSFFNKTGFVMKRNPGNADQWQVEGEEDNYVSIWFPSSLEFLDSAESFAARVLGADYFDG